MPKKYGAKEAERMKKLFLSKKLFLLDGDGTLYMWNTAFKRSRDFIEKLIGLGKSFIILSNNDSESKKSRLGFIEKIFKIKINEDQLLLPNDIVEDFLNEKRIRSFDGLVSDDFKDELIRKGFVYDEKNPQIILIGFDVDLSYRKIERTIDHINSGKKFILTHNDPLCPYKDGKAIPDAGIISYMISSATGIKPAFTFGKPFKSTVSYILARHKISKKDCLIIGDRLGTDIKMANENKIDSIWLTNDEKDPEKAIKKSEYKPSFQVHSINDLYAIIKDT